MLLDNYFTWDGFSTQFNGQDVGPVLEVPMLFGQELIGVLVVDEKSDSKRKFNHEDSRLLSLIASATAGTVFSTRLLEQTRARAEEYKSLYEITQEITTSGRNLDTLLEYICGKAAELLHAKRGAIYLFDPLVGTLELKYTLGFESQVGVKLALGEGMAGRVAMTREAMIVDNYSTWEGRSEQLSDQDFGAVLEVPLIFGQELIGVLVINETSNSPRIFTQEDSRILSLVASATAGLVYNTHLLEQTKMYGQQMESVNSLGRAMAESLDLNEIYDRLCQAAIELVSETDEIIISNYDSESSSIEIVYAVKLGADRELIKLAIPVKTSFPNDALLKVIQSGRLITENHAEKTSISPENTTEDRNDPPSKSSAIYIPMLAEGEVLGAIQLVSNEKSEFTKTEADLLTLVANTAAVAIQNSNLVKKLRQRVDQLSSLHAIDTAISSTTDLRMSLQTILGNVTRLLNVDAADIQLLNPTTLILEPVASRGFRTNELLHTSLRIGEGRLGQSVLDRKMVLTDSRRELLSDQTRKSLAEVEEFHAHVAAPLIAKGQVRGVLEIFNRSPIKPNSDWLDFLDVLSAQASLAIDSGQMFENLGRANMELTLAYDATIEGWSQAMDLRDKETEGHTRRVTELAIELARKLDLNPALLVHMRRGALLHDIGKMGIPDRILLKNDELTEAEWETMKKHPSHAELLMSHIDYLRPAMDIPAYHHEKWDGSGYPNGLKGEQIPLTARIFAVVDVYDALTSDRPYRSAWTREKALDYIREQSGKHFDPSIAKVFLKMI
jgi:putative nucleotidyltransferase with HDIG domain